MKKKYLFGPVLSRRLGKSLGVDIVPLKVCNLNCVYCECGSTTKLTMERKEWLPAEEIIKELHDFLSSNPKIDFVTITGSGEPTLNTILKEIIEFLKKEFPQYSTALLTNGTLFTLSEVRNASLLFDYVLPSLDAASPEVFKKINRPHNNLNIIDIIEGLSIFKKQYTGTLWLEVFIAPGINDSKEELILLKDAISKISPDRVQLNSLDRPGACKCVTSSTPQRLKEIADLLKPLPVEILSRKYIPEATFNNNHEICDTAILSVLSRRPCTIEEIAHIAEKNINEILFIVDKLIKEKKIEKEIVNNRIYYKIAP